MADEDPNRQRLEDMLKASEQRRPAGGSPGENASGQGGDKPREERAPLDGDGGEGNGERPARATGTAKTMVTAGLVMGGLSIPGALFAIVGLALGIAAIVLGVMVSRRSADARAKIAMGLGALGVVLSIVSGVIGIVAMQEDSGNGGDDSEESDDEDSGGDSDSDEDSGGDSDGDEDSGDSSSLLPPYVVAVTYRGAPV